MIGRQQKLMMAAGVVAVGMIGASRSMATNFTWTGGTSGSSTPWLTATNWDLGSVPTGTDVAVFQAGGPNPGINMNGATNNGANNEAIGEILIGSASGNRIITNSSTSKAGTLTFNGVNDGTNNVLLSNVAVGKSLTFTNNATSVAATLTAAFATAGVINVSDAGSSVIFNNAATNAGGTITKTGAGTLTLASSSENFSGGLTVSGGTVLINNYATGPNTFTGNVATSAGTTLGGNGTIAGSVSNSGVLAPGGVGTVGNFNVGTLTLNAGAATTFDFGASSADEVLAPGGLILGGNSTVNLNNLGGLANGTFNLFDFSGGGFSGNVGQLSIGNAPAGPTYSFQISGSLLQLVVSGFANNLTWAGAISGAWDTATANWTGTATKFSTGDVVTFNDAGTATNVTVAAGGVQPSAATFSNNTKDYTVSGGPIAGSGSLAKTGTGTLTLNSANTFTGPTTVSAGTLVLGVQGAIGGTSQLALSGGATLKFGAAQTLDRAMSITGTGATLDTQGFNVTYSGANSGTGAITKAGTGTLVLSGTGGTTGTGAIALTAGKISVTAVNPANGAAGLGTGNVTLSGGTTYELVGAQVGFKSGGAVGTGITLNVGDGATLSGLSSGATAAAITGTIGFPASASPAAAVGHAVAPGAGDRLVIGSAVRNFGTQATNTGVISVEGNGVVQLASGATSSTSNSQYNGTWQVNMGPTGVLSVGPVLPGGFGEALNALGYDQPATNAGPYNALTRPVVVNSGTLAIGADKANLSSTNPPSTTSFRSPITLNGGRLASTGSEYTSFDVTNGSQIGGGPVTPNIAADVTTTPGTTSTVLLYDPVLGPGGGSRSINITTDALGYSTPVPGTLNWGAGSTLAVDAGGTTGGVLTFSRTNDPSNAVTVGAGAKLSIGPGATVVLGGNALIGDSVGQDALYDGTTAVAVLNAGSFQVTGGVKHVAGVAGAGTTSVSNGSTLVITPGSATSLQSALTIDGSSLVDLNNNSLAINYTGGSVADTVRGELQSGRNGGAWNGSTGITSSTAAAIANSTTAIGYAEASAKLGASGGTWQGVSVDGTSLLLKYTYYGDANLDGTVDGDDYALLDKGFAKHVANAHWTDGDFDYDGQVTSADYFLADNAYGHLTGTLSPDLLSERLAQFGPDYVAALVTAVPEPTSLAVCGLAVLPMLGRRRWSAK